MIVQWAEIEASFAAHYNLSIRDLEEMSWRRFRVLFGAIFSWNEPDEAPQTIASTVDWSKAVHKSVKEISASPGITTNRIAVGRGE